MKSVTLVLIRESDYPEGSPSEHVVVRVQDGIDINAKGVIRIVVGEIFCDDAHPVTYQAWGYDG